MEIFKLDTPELFILVKQYSEQPTRAQQREFAYALLLQDFAPNDTIVYDQDGKPHFSNLPYACSISHSGKYIAIARSSAPSIGIDIQKESPKVMLVIAKFLSLEEQKLLHSYSKDTERIALLFWSAKESAYKWQGQKGTAFQEIQIQEIFFTDSSKNEGYLTLYFREKMLKINFYFLNDAVLTWITLVDMK